MTHMHPENAHVSASEATSAAAAPAAPADSAERDDAVVQLADALRGAERAHRAYQAELCLGDVEAADDWSVWYAEYLLGLR
jgi:hypothetical protein